jgi:hypothetical protein
MITAVTGVVSFLTGCGAAENLPDAAYRSEDFEGLAAHPEYQLLYKLGVPQPLPAEGYASLGRQITNIDELISVADFVTHHGWPDPEMASTTLLGRYFTVDMYSTFSSAIACDHGSGDVIALMKPGYETRFERAYRAVPRKYKNAWRQAAKDTEHDCCGSSSKEFDAWAYHPIGIGNGFVVFKTMNATKHSNDKNPTEDSWSYAGLARLVCHDGQIPVVNGSRWMHATPLVPAVILSSDIDEIAIPSLFPGPVYFVRATSSDCPSSANFVRRNDGVSKPYGALELSVDSSGLDGKRCPHNRIRDTRRVARHRPRQCGCVNDALAPHRRCVRLTFGI